ncbi:MAG: hypothetical protein ACJ739_04780 [Acidimicrobiales bacterium]
MRLFRPHLLLVPAFSLALLGACGDDDDNGKDAGDAVDEASNDAVETAARNIASAQAEDEFSAKGVDVDGDLTCEANADEGADAVKISCIGTSTDGKDLGVEGQTDEIPGASVTELEGLFVGKADGKEVFSVDTLGG